MVISSLIGILAFYAITNMKKRGFTVIDLLISISIIGLMLGLLVTNMDHSLSRNRIANDAELFAAKVEEVRLMAGSTQSIDEQAVNPDSDNDVGYYALYVPESGDYFYILKLPTNIPRNFAQGSNLDKYVVQKNSLTKGVSIVARNSSQLVAYKVPTQQLYAINWDSAKWNVADPVFTSPFFSLGYQNKTADVKVMSNTAKVEITYR